MICEELMYTKSNDIIIIKVFFYYKDIKQYHKKTIKPNNNH